MEKQAYTQVALRCHELRRLYLSGEVSLEKITELESKMATSMQQTFGLEISQRAIQKFQTVISAHNMLAYAGYYGGNIGYIVALVISLAMYGKEITHEADKMIVRNANQDQQLNHE